MRGGELAPNARPDLHVRRVGWATWGVGSVGVGGRATHIIPHGEVSDGKRVDGEPVPSRVGLDLDDVAARLGEHEREGAEGAGAGR